MAEPVTMDILLRLARVNGDLMTATDTATVITRLIEGADVVFAVWATNPASEHFEQMELSKELPRHHFVAGLFVCRLKNAATAAERAAAVARGGICIHVYFGAVKPGDESQRSRSATVLR